MCLKVTQESEVGTGKKCLEQKGIGGICTNKH